MLASETDVVRLIPQKPPFVMVSKLLFSDRIKTVSSFKVSNDCLLIQDGLLSESGLVENIAQTAAAGVGYVCIQDNIPVPVGFIAAIKNLKVYSLPEVGSEIKTEVVVQNQVLDITIIFGKCFSREKLLAECEMRIFVKPD